MAESKTATLNKPGWLDLSSRDAAVSRAFYSALFGWTADLVPDPEAGGYAMFKLDGKEVGGVGPLQNESAPTAWTMYVIVGDADGTAQRVRDAGGAVLAEPFDVMGEGRMAIVADPSGAAFGLWQPGRHQGWEVEGVPGSVCWVELVSRDIDGAKRFYHDVFGWTHKSEMDADPGVPYTTFGLEGMPDFAGGLPMVPSETRAEASYWQPYFAVADVEAATKAATDREATLLLGPIDAEGIGTWSVLQDPLGAVFALLQPPAGR